MPPPGAEVPTSGSLPAARAGHTGHELHLVEDAGRRHGHFRQSSSTFFTMAPIPSWMWWSSVSHMKAGVVTTLFFWST